MTQRGTFAYPGSKTLIRKWIYEKFANHHLYVEPFGGAASVLVGKPRSKMEVYNDINDDVVNFFNTVKYHNDELIEWIENTPYSRSLFDKFVESYKGGWPDDSVEQAGRFLYVQNAAFGGKGFASGTPTFGIQKVDSQPESCNAKVWLKKPRDIQWLKQRFQGVQIESLDYTKIIEKYDHEDALFYFDPPYVDVGNGYYETQDGEFDHTRFSDVVTSMDAKWVISYDHQIPESLAEYTTITRQKTANISSERPEKTESLVLNYDPEQTVLFTESSQYELGNYQ